MFCRREGANQNIYINGSVLGLSKKGTGAPGGAEDGCRRQARRASRVGRTANQIDEKIDEIIDFAEIREFIDMPVQSYSSGMPVLGVRCGFQFKPGCSDFG